MKIKKILMAKTQNSETYLTSGFATYVTNDEGTDSPEKVWELLNLFSVLFIFLSVYLFKGFSQHYARFCKIDRRQCFISCSNASLDMCTLYQRHSNALSVKNVAAFICPEH